MTPPTAPERCPTCDREGCPKLLPAEHTEECRSDCPRCAAIDDCHAHRVDWRARAIAAEAATAQWAKVAPLIERLRKADASFSANDSTVDAIDALLAATEATP